MGNESGEDERGERRTKGEKGRDGATQNWEMKKK